MKEIAKEEENPLSNKFWIKTNEKHCLKQKKKCDELGKKPENYPTAIKVAIVHDVVYPVVLLVLWALFSGFSLYTIFIHTSFLYLVFY